jgi:sulfite reductase (ferredoxin)
MATKSWKQALGERIPADLGAEIDIFETQIEQRRQGKLDDKVFAESRLRRGVYGQRYDNGQRHDGIESRTLAYPSGELLKGPGTLWDAPGMVRIKIPYGGVSPAQMETLAELAEEYSDGILHVTTRQDIQLHFVHIDDTPDLMRRLAAAGITTREACGNSVRNVTGCPLAGVCRTEAFDVTPYARATMRFLLGHPDVQDFGRKFKIAFSGCADEACGLVMLHDAGAIAKTRVVDGAERRGFELWVGGGLGAVPHQAVRLEEFLPVEELLPTFQAISRVYARLGEKKNRARARIKFLVAKLGIDEFRRLVLEERKTMPHDPRWTEGVATCEADPGDGPPAGAIPAQREPGRAGGFDAWVATNVYRQRQPGFAAVTVTLPLGDFTPRQARCLADLARIHANGSMRLTVDQNVLLRWVSEPDLPALHAALGQAGLGQGGAQSIVDITSCPGTDTCKLGISSSRGLSRELRGRLAARAETMDGAERALKLKVSGCFNSCGQHHVADLGFYGVTRKKGGFHVPFFQLILGGQWHGNAGAYGLATGAIPSKNVPRALERITDGYLRERQTQESFQDYIRRVGKARIRESIEDLLEVPGHDEDPSYYSDWGDPREYTTGDMGIGECAGEVVSSLDFGLAAAERQVFEAQIALEERQDPAAAVDLSVRAMLTAARELVRTQWQDVPEDAATVAAEFRKRFYDTRLFFDPFVGPKFAHFFFQALDEPLADFGSNGKVHRLVEEAQLFIEAAYACSNRMGGTSATAGA